MEASCIDNNKRITRQETGKRDQHTKKREGKKYRVERKTKRWMYSESGTKLDEAKHGL